MVNKLTAGESRLSDIKATDYNLALDVAEAFRRGQLSTTAGRGDGSKQSTYVLCQNTSAVDAEPFTPFWITSVIKPGGETTLEVDVATLAFAGNDKAGLLCEIYDTRNNNEALAIPIEPIPKDGGVGWAVVAGVVPCWLTYSNAATQTHADFSPFASVQPHPSLLTGAAGCVRILGNDIAGPENEQALALVLIGYRPETARIKKFRLVDNVAAPILRDVPKRFDSIPDDPPIVTDSYTVRAVPQRWENGATQFDQLPGLYIAGIGDAVLGIWIAENAGHASLNPAYDAPIENIYVSGNWQGFAFGNSDGVNNPDGTGTIEDPPTINVDIRGGNGWLVDALYDEASAKWFLLGCGATAFKGTVVEHESQKRIRVIEKSHWESDNYSRLIPLENTGSLDAVAVDDAVTCFWNPTESEFFVFTNPGDLTAGCAIDFTDGEISFVPAEAIGDESGLEVIPGETEEDCDTLAVKIGCHMQRDADGVDVDVATLIDAESGLEVVAGACPTLKVKVGCGTMIDVSGAVAVDNTALEGPGIVADGTCGLQIDIDRGCGIAGSGNEIHVDNTELAGTGLVAGDGCALDVSLTIGCGLTGAGSSVAFDNVSVAQSGLGSVGTCGLEVKTGCGIQITSDAVAIKRADLIAADGGLQAGIGTCDLEVKSGCGIVVDADGVGIYRPDILGDGLEAGPTGCLIKVKADCGISVGPDGVAVDLNTLISNGTDTSGLTVKPGEGAEPCFYIGVNAGCGIEINVGGEVAVKRADLMQASGGIVAGSGTCDMKVDLSDTSPLWSETFTCIPFVADVTWNEETCVMTKTMNYLRIPDNVPVTVNTTACP